MAPNTSLRSTLPRSDTASLMSATWPTALGNSWLAENRGNYKWQNGTSSVQSNIWYPWYCSCSIVQKLEQEKLIWSCDIGLNYSKQNLTYLHGVGNMKIYIRQRRKYLHVYIEMGMKVWFILTFDLYHLHKIDWKPSSICLFFYLQWHDLTWLC